MINEKTLNAIRYANIMADFDSHHYDSICKHYAHAKEKHPYFCNAMAPLNWPTKEWEKVDLRLSSVRARVSKAIKRKNLGWDDVLDCEVWEVLSAIAHGDIVHAVDECYDAIAVLLRTIDVLDGRQKLGKNETKGEAK